MSDALIMLNTGISIAIIVLLIMVLRVGPVLALLAGAIYLGLTSGLGFEVTAETLSEGFGGILAAVGLVIALGVLLGSLLSTMGALQSIVAKLIHLFSPRGLPYASSLVWSTLFPVIYGDVLLVLMAPLVRSLAPRLGKSGMGTMSTALAIGINVGLVFVVPGAAAIAIAGLLGVPLGVMFISGIVVAIPTAILTMMAYRWLENRGLWAPETDEIDNEDAGEAAVTGPDRTTEDEVSQPGEATTSRQGGTADPTKIHETLSQYPPLRISLSPILIALLLISLGVFANIAGFSSGILVFLSNGVVAIFIAFVFAYFLSRRYMGRERTEQGLGHGFRESGLVLIVTGAGGSFAAMIGKTGLEDILGAYFSSGALPPLLLAWLVAALLEIALGSATVAIITAGGILAPVVGTLDVPTVLIALAASSGALFGIHLNSNFFWIFQPLIGLSTKGTLKTLTLSMAIASLISLALIMAASLVF